MNGCEAAHRIRTIERNKGWPYTPIVAVSAYVEEKDKFGAAGIDAYIAKVFFSLPSLLYFLLSSLSSLLFYFLYFPSFPSLFQ